MFSEDILCAEAQSFGGYRMYLNNGDVLDISRYDALTMDYRQLRQHISERIWQVKDAEEEAKKASVPEVRGFRIGTKSAKRNKPMDIST